MFATIRMEKGSILFTEGPFSYRLRRGTFGGLENYKYAAFGDIQDVQCSTENKDKELQK